MKLNAIYLRNRMTRGGLSPLLETVSVHSGGIEIDRGTMTAYMNVSAVDAENGAELFSMHIEQSFDHDKVSDDLRIALAVEGKKYGEQWAAAVIRNLSYVGVTASIRQTQESFEDFDHTDAPHVARRMIDYAWQMYEGFKFKVSDQIRYNTNLGAIIAAHQFEVVEPVIVFKSDDGEQTDVVLDHIEQQLKRYGFHFTKNGDDIVVNAGTDHERGDSDLYREMPSVSDRMHQELFVSNSSLKKMPDDLLTHGTGMVAGYARSYAASMNRDKRHKKKLAAIRQIAASGKRDEGAERFLTQRLTDGIIDKITLVYHAKTFGGKRWPALEQVLIGPGQAAAMQRNTRFIPKNLSYLTYLNNLREDWPLGREKATRVVRAVADGMRIKFVKEDDGRVTRKLISVPSIAGTSVYPNRILTNEQFGGYLERNLDRSSPEAKKIAAAVLVWLQMARAGKQPFPWFSKPPSEAAVRFASGVAATTRERAQ